MKRVLAICLGLVVLIPASASATTVKLGPAVPGTPSGAPACSTFTKCPSQTYFQQTVQDPSIAIAASGDGKVTSWGATGSGPMKLRVLRPVGASVVGEGTSAAVVADKSGGPYATSLAIRAGDLIASTSPTPAI